MALDHHLVQPGLGRLQILGRQIPFVELVDKCLARLTIPGQNDLLYSRIEQVQLFVELLEDVLEIGREPPQGREVDCYVVVIRRQVSP